MKTITKTLAVLFLVLAPMAGSAQKQFYHNVGDTITNLDTIYWRPAWFDKITRPDTSTDFCMDRLQFPLVGAGEILMKCYTDKPLQVIGIATSVYILNDVETYDTLRRPEQVRLYQAYPGDSLELKLAFWYDLDDPHRTTNIESRILPHHCCDTIWRVFNSRPIYEYYAEKPVTIVDSFYIGGTTYSLNDEGDSTHLFPNIPAYTSLCSEMHSLACPECEFPDVEYRFKNYYQTITQLPAGYVKHFTDDQYMYTFPILLIDTSFVDTGSTAYVCPEVKHLRLGASWENGGTLLWDVEAQHNLWQVRLLSAGGDVESPLVDTTVNVPYFTFTGLQPATHYDVRVRALCEHNGDTLSSEWSAPVDLYTVEQTSGIDQPSDALVQLLPNPARDRVQVLSGFPLRSVTLYDLRGNRLLQQEAQGVSTELVVGHLPQGIYIVLVHNQQGTSTKKLILQ